MIRVDRNSLANIVKKLNIAQQSVIDLIIDNLEYIGEQSVKIAREKGSYGDITGNLRSSIGYVVLYNGIVQRQGQPKQYQGSKGDGSAGAPAAAALLEKLKGQYPRGAVLIVCAGMEYAVYVEAVHHKDVLTSAQLTAENLANNLLKKLVKTRTR